MHAEIRHPREEELDSLLRADTAAFGELLKEETLPVLRSVVELDRALVATEGDAIVAGLTTATFRLTVPGPDAVPCAGVTSAWTLPTHRRRGLLRALMNRHLEELRERGDPFAYLWASEAAIYQRFGYGLGTITGTINIRREGTAFLREIETAGRMRLAERDEALKLVPDIYERVRTTRPGMIDRPGPWLEYTWRQPEHPGGGPEFFAFYETDSGPQGYVAYRIKEGWSLTTGPNHELDISELVWATDDAYTALWRYCFGVDLVRRVTGWKRPIDEPLLHMLAEPRALGFQFHDGTWLRLVDVAAALEARRYSQEGRVVIEVDDALAPWNDGTYELEGGPEGATCRPSGAEPDLSMRVEDLAAAYLGAVSFRTLAKAGRVVERGPGALTTADAMFSTTEAPWCPWIF